MSESKAAGRYAKSLIDLSKEQNALEDLKRDMLAFEAIVERHSELSAILKNPIVPLDKKLGILEALFKNTVHTITLSFFKLLVNKGRAALLVDIASQFIKQYNEFKGIVKVEVSTATSLTDAAKAEVIALVKNKIGANEVQLVEKVDEQLIGGLVLKVGDRQFDGSIANGLNRLKKELAGRIA